MSKKTTAEKLQAELERKQQIENGIKELQKQQRAEERRERDKRHTERGAIAERLFDPKAELSNEAFQKMLEDVFNICHRQNSNAKTSEPPAPKEEIGEEESED